MAERSPTCSFRSARRRPCAAGATSRSSTYGRMVALCAKAAEQLAKEGDRRRGDRPAIALSVRLGAIKESVRRTGRVVFVNEDTEVTNFGEHLIRRAIDELSTSSTRRRSCSRGRTCRGSASRTTSRRRACRSSRGSWARCARSRATSRSSTAPSVTLPTCDRGARVWSRSASMRLRARGSTWCPRRSRLRSARWASARRS